MLHFTVELGQYIVEQILKKKNIDPNDDGDMELFTYLNSRSIIVTSEKKWKRYANQCGRGSQVRLIKISH